MGPPSRIGADFELRKVRNLDVVFVIQRAGSK